MSEITPARIWIDLSHDDGPQLYTVPCDGVAEYVRADLCERLREACQITLAQWNAIRQSIHSAEVADEVVESINAAIGMVREALE